MGSCKIEITTAPTLIGCPNDNDIVLLVKSDNSKLLRLTFAQLKACVLLPSDINGIVGQSQNMPAIGATMWQNAAFVGYHVDLIINKIPQTELNWDGIYFSKDVVSDTILFTGRTIQDGDLIQLSFRS